MVQKRRPQDLGNARVLKPARFKSLSLLADQIREHGETGKANSLFVGIGAHGTRRIEIGVGKLKVGKPLHVGKPEGGGGVDDLLVITAFRRSIISR